MPTTSIGVRSRAKPFIGLPKVCALGAAIGGRIGRKPLPTKSSEIRIGKYVARRFQGGDEEIKMLF
jgi:hypothetical protein